MSQQRLIETPLWRYLLVGICLLITTSISFAQEAYRPVTNTSELNDGDKILICYIGYFSGTSLSNSTYYNYSMGTKLSSDASYIEVENKFDYNNPVIETNYTDSQIFTIESNQTGYALKNNSNGKYLNHNGSKFEWTSNINDVRPISISFNEIGAALISWDDNTCLNPVVKSSTIGMQIGNYDVNKSIYIFSNRDVSSIYNPLNCASLIGLEFASNNWELSNGIITASALKATGNDLLTNATSLRLRAGNILSISATEGYYIKYIEFNHTTLSYHFGPNDTDTPLFNNNLGIWKANDNSTQELTFTVTPGNVQIRDIKVYYGEIGGETPPSLPVAPCPTPANDNHQDSFITFLQVVNPDNDETINDAQINYAITYAPQASEIETSHIYHSPISLGYYLVDDQPTYLWAWTHIEGYQDSQKTLIGQYTLTQDFKDTQIDYKHHAATDIIEKNFYIITASDNGYTYALGKQNIDGSYSAIRLVDRCSDILAAWYTQFKTIGVTECIGRNGHLYDTNSRSYITPSQSALSRATSSVPTSTYYNSVDRRLTIDNQILGFDPETKTFGFGLPTPAMLMTTGSGISTSIDEILFAPTSNEPIYYNLQGIRIDQPTTGLYIEVIGNVSRKIIK